jgi:Fe-S-cluster containining protein
MNKKSTKFLSTEDAINELFLELIHPEKWYQIALFAKVFGYLSKGSANPGTKYCNSSEREEKGIWSKARGAKKEDFIRPFDFKEAAIDLIPKVIDRTEDIARAYEWAMWVKATTGKGNNGESGVLVETEMEKFRCVQCGNCCLNLPDAFATTVDAAEIERWRYEGRMDILDWVSIFELDGNVVFGDIWISPNTGDCVTRCPWIRKLPRQNKYKCRIHDTKPAICRDYPRSKKHALTTGCKGFGNDSTFEKVKADLKRMYQMG